MSTNMDCYVPYRKIQRYQDIANRICDKEVVLGKGWNDRSNVVNQLGPNWGNRRSRIAKTKQGTGAINSTGSELEHSNDDRNENAHLTRSSTKYKEALLDDDRMDDPFAMNIILSRLKQIRVFGPNEKLTVDCEKYRFNYDSSWDSSMRVYGKCKFTPSMIKEYPDLANTFILYSNPFELSDVIVRMIAVDDLRKMFNKTWNHISKDLATNIKKLNTHYKTNIITSVIPYVSINPHAHLVRNFNTSNFILTTGIPISYLLEDDQRGIDKLSYVLYATNQEITFGVGHKLDSSTLKTTALQLSPSLYQVRFRFDNADKACILSSFLNMCSIVLNENATQSIYDLSKRQNKNMKSQKRCVECLSTLRIGYLLKSNPKENMFGFAKEWIMTTAAESSQPFLVAITGQQNIHGHCVAIINHQIVDGLYERSCPLTMSNLDYILGEYVVNIMWCMTFYPNEQYMKVGTPFLNYKDYQKQKK